MKNAENGRMLSEEAAVGDAEAAVAQSEQALWARAHALETDDTAARAKAALARVTALESAGKHSNELTKARAVLTGAATPLPLAVPQRTAAIAARKSALKARDNASHSLAAALGPVEPLKAAARQNLDAIEGYVNKLQGKVQETLQRRQQAAPNAGKGH